MRSRALRLAAGVATALVVATTACSPVHSTTHTQTPTSSPSHESSGRTSVSASPDQRPLAGKVIVVDPGHNGGNGTHPERISRLVNAGGLRKPCNTVGAETASGYTEHAFNWDVANRLARLLRARGAKVVLTRKNDEGVGPCVDERGKIAAKHHADLLVSVHADGSVSAGHGFAVLEPEKVKGYTDSTYRRSELLATHLVDALVRQGLHRSTYLGHDGVESRHDLGTLNLADSPAVMLEAGNMRNAKDAKLLRSVEGRQRIAAGMAAGITSFCRT